MAPLHVAHAGLNQHGLPASDHRQPSKAVIVDPLQGAAVHTCAAWDLDQKQSCVHVLEKGQVITCGDTPAKRSWALLDTLLLCLKAILGRISKQCRRTENTNSSYAHEHQGCSTQDKHIGAQYRAQHASHLRPPPGPRP